MRVVPDDQSSRQLYDAIDNITDAVNITSIEIDGIIPRSPYYVPIQASCFWLDIHKNGPILEAIRSDKEWCMSNLPFNDKVQILLFRSDV
jgi:hypothetical protein